MFMDFLKAAARETGVVKSCKGLHKGVMDDGGQFYRPEKFRRMCLYSVNIVEMGCT